MVVLQAHGSADAVATFIKNKVVLCVCRPTFNRIKQFKPNPKGNIHGGAITDGDIDDVLRVVRRMIFDRFRPKRDPSLQYTDGADGRPFVKNGTPQITRLPGYNKDGTPRTGEPHK